MSETPSPGSAGAHEQGCICPTFDNCHGAGIYTDASGERQFVVFEGCPLHDCEPATGEAA